MKFSKLTRPELEEILKNAGFDVDVSAITIEEAKTSILKALGKK